MIVSGPPAFARRLRITGVVQGVGFRPFVHRLAIRHELSGWVRNVGGEVQIGVQGTDDAVEAFIGALTREAPPLARIERLEVESAALEPYDGFVIEASHDPAGLRQPVSPDVALCAACEAELFDPANRRYRYPFITCTDCGPRFTVIEAMPYDRERTSMRQFTQCAACAREYRTPSDRRYHSETNSCPVCGPRLWFESAGEAVDGAGAAIAAAVSLLRAGGILALRGLGGFHLAVDARSDASVARLRRRKQRDAKPFAVMVRTLADAAEIAELTHAAADILASPVRPVVVLPERAGSRLSRGIAPRIGSVGLMLPSTPLHHLLLDLARGPLVMTSGNLSEEPIATGIDEARARLSAVADGFLLHDREIVSRYDDSVVRVLAGPRGDSQADMSLRGAQRRSNRVGHGEGRPMSDGPHERPDCRAPAALAMTSGAGTIILRRARGLAPLPLRLPVPSPEPLVAVGPDLKNTFTLVDGARAYVSQHIGDLDSLETVTHFRDTLRRFEQLFQIVPSVAARDLHPGYLSTRIAEELGLPQVIPVQHHHAHIAAVLAEHGETGPVIGLAFDGTGYGDDGHVWGAEVLLADLAGYRRLAQLRYAPMPGGDRAAREPWRAALGYLSLQPDAEPAFAAAFDTVPGRERAMAALQIKRRLNAPLASSMGRLFDAASAVLRVHRGRQFEGQAAMELEALAGGRAGRVLEMPLDTTGDVWQLDPLPLLIALGERRRDGADAGQLAADFHASVIAAAARVAALSCERSGIGTVALGGGVFQNARFAVELPASLEAAGLRVLLPRELGPNDGAVSYGQAAIAAARLAAESPV